MRSMRLALRALVTGMALALGASASLADTVELNDGTVHKGKVVADSPEVVGFKTDAGKLLMIKKADIKELKKEEAAPEEPKGKKGPQPMPGKRPEKPAKITMEVLKSRKVSFDFVNTPLKDVLRFVGDLAGVTIVLDEKSVAEPKPITLKAKDLDLRSALGWITFLTGLAYCERDGCLLITTPESAIKTRMEMYLVERVTRKGSGDELVDLVKKVCAPGTWGEKCSAVYRNGRLVVVQTEEALGTVKWLLAELASPGGKGRELQIGESAGSADALLKGKTISFDFVETPIRDVVTSLSRKSGVLLVLDTGGKDGPRSVTLRVNDMDLQKALAWILKLVGMEIMPRDGGLLITTRERALAVAPRVLGVYDVLSLLSSPRGRPRKEDPESDKIAGDSLAEFVMKTIAPGKWGDEFGMGCVYFGGRLVVLSTREVQVEVAKLLANFRKNR